MGRGSGSSKIAPEPQAWQAQVRHIQHNTKKINFIAATSQTCQNLMRVLGQDAHGTGAPQPAPKQAEEPPAPAGPQAPAASMAMVPAGANISADTEGHQGGPNNYYCQLAP